ncbi:hypothetical protein ESA94_04105 [Lacibacter luteus]|uniref:Secreted protein n=1 Tax=Lacibacter luteus TaxID=2508719 RepID=A0A4Q1CMF4_9BACT|nr:hypothetical protein [Lacibacter luteus]RXK62203.1 hypothetical protein ESA94_04105 [Lacibacter luteus]
MKKLIIAILAILYIGTASGATVQLHYCMGKLVNMSIGHDDSNTCDNCGMEKDGKGKNDCCKDEQKQIKLEKDQKVAESFQAMQLIATAIPVSSIVYTLPHVTSVTEENPRSNAPPLTDATSLYIRNCTFRI